MQLAPRYLFKKLNFTGEGERGGSYLAGRFPVSSFFPECDNIKNVFYKCIEICSQ